MKFSQVERWLASTVRPCAVITIVSPPALTGLFTPASFDETALLQRSDDMSFRGAGILVLTFAHQRDARDRRQSGGDRRAFSGVRA